ncbi:hypothetical protein CLAFUW4_06397 [Fulvia fulva]|uniref:Heme haloperoxidase family profile domain-containing protein n=1 Tax=Passalora fulva TaxID=5499 RepID=A0A9Q8LIQ1_PASFU|nr:uncharacterized protein CLAFUR5_06541 [Fulvia fulva]KAK4623846.1 hypothetical protein CLAFUR4_06400 [Fulvia fulva]KAK4626011.1 hypothetical protein CLAFUR0_06401 [Fulvia fulva]UJO17859.1 hypothetical protein CLAFUR5_06541 [Fulvia fulva]WPV15302.1 hypothetical protein CLAFUW4_06397 [Fulvia fulva]WPV29751.1 hypothetical protein CLAFUW7_06395 [Fulvia fulva]
MLSMGSITAYSKSLSSIPPNLDGPPHIYQSADTMKASTGIALSVAGYAAAFHFVLELANQAEMAQPAHLLKREEPPPREPVRKLNLPNTGTPPLPFNAQDQYVDVTEGSGHEWRAPLPGQLRGECPGLNAAANHGFLDRPQRSDHHR